MLYSPYEPHSYGNVLMQIIFYELYFRIPNPLDLSPWCNKTLVLTTLSMPRVGKSVTLWPWILHSTALIYKNTQAWKFSQYLVKNINPAIFSFTSWLLYIAHCSSKALLSHSSTWLFGFLLESCCSYLILHTNCIIFTFGTNNIFSLLTGFK